MPLPRCAGCWRSPPAGTTRGKVVRHRGGRWKTLSSKPISRRSIGVYSSPSQLLNLEMLRRPLECRQYTSIAFGLRCDEAGVRPSMGSVADCYDNAMCESFFATLECELLDQEPLRTKTEARMAVFDFIEGWYNPHRRHSALGYQSPSAFERESRELVGSAHEPRSLVHRQLNPGVSS